MTLRQTSTGARASSKTHVVLAVLRMDTGGTERCIANIASKLDRARFHVSVLCFDRTGPASNWINAEDVDLVELHLATGNSFKAVRAVEQALRSLKADIVHSHNWGTLIESSLAAKWAGSVAHIHSERGVVLGSDGCGPFKRRLRASAMRWLCGRCSALVANAHSVASKMSKITGVPLSELHVIPNGVDAPHQPDTFQAMRADCRRELGLQPSSFVLGSVGRITGVKNYEMAITALARVHEQTPCKPHLVLVGDGPLRGPIEEAGRRESIGEYLHLVGEQSNTWRYLAAMDVFINTSWCEGMSQAILEAMAAGLPIIATDVGDAASMLLQRSQACGIIVKPGDSQGMANAIADLSEPRLRATYAHIAALRHREQYKLANMIDAYEALYTQVARAKQTANCRTATK